MEIYKPTTPFGRRPLAIGQLASLSLVEAAPAGKPVHKWNLLHAACAARVALGLSERALMVLDALLSFHPETALMGGALVVFPSNEALSLRAKGMPGSTLRRHLAALVDAGLVVRRDSPNGKRYARKDAAGEIETAFGFDLAPFVARSDEIEALAAEARAAQRAIDYARERITVCRRDIAKTLAAAEFELAARGDESARSALVALHEQFRAVVDRIPRRRCRETLEAIAGELTKLAGEAFVLLRRQAKTAEMGAIGACNGRHIESSNPESKDEDESVLREGMKGQEGKEVPGGHKASSAEDAFTVRQVIEACPDIVEYAKHGVRDWNDLVATANLVSGLLGVSPGGWKEARSSLGDCGAAAAIAYILQRGSAIRSAGGYLRRLSRKNAAGEMSINRMVMASLHARRRQVASKPPAPLPGLSAAALRIMMPKTEGAAAFR
ncbi:MAG TPA: plasmid replication protein RepC [Beijerinckiaceae bacterium]|nr:replication initiation protein RepC [Rhodoblastus sp.]MCC2109789.1 replication initiation protein RepC [Hyphomicrobiales bacterium]HRY02417.1 plasmid replication protein RepC [Beijerinckiaceae bacterium]